ncbi:uncharacterized protein F5Z01DRAFT_273256 [Emericellopsis atlantica]|uniref:DUF2264 domain-containing protein n=1 Tax=Emericellopsis atlantica TaxID=2614577 RepID=A0A9P8CM20_9HYPO|nr:uncharacterized protein F5Z01DRAFT_273256 [Emericellopsis atlantica]KAG9251622.1 hypothetical protein F5Z01DRAFT_273256 [Emericellopsis atlantica]
MPPLAGFTDNPMQSRSDLLRALHSLIKALEPHTTSHPSRTKIRPATCAAFDDVAAQLEGFARPLLGIHAVVQLHDDERLATWIKGLEEGVRVDAPGYWGDIGDVDQRMVETESICLAILGYPDEILGRMSQEGKGHLRTWLAQMYGKAMPANNWRWFRILVSVTLTQHLDMPPQEVEHEMEADFALLDSFYLGHGWSSDGAWGDERRQADYYSGSFAMQFAQLLYVRFGPDADKERKNKYMQWASAFAQDYWRYFDADGSAIPFGRSMTYRFAMGAFWAAAAASGAWPASGLAMLKGMLLRHLRWWRGQEDMFNVDGTLNIGFSYPNMYLSEDYNSPQSVYWCLKSFVVLLLPAEHAFWQVDEASHPVLTLSLRNMTRTIWPARQVIDSWPGHHYLLSSGQMTTKPHKARDAKYCKFAYSSTFGFSVPCGSDTLGQIAPDSTLSLSIDGGESWRVRCRPDDARLQCVSVGEESVDALVSTWHPWSRLDLDVETTLIPLGAHFPGWHLRVHRLMWSLAAEAALLDEAIQLVDGGFAVPALTRQGYHVPKMPEPDLETVSEGFCRSDRGALVRSAAGTCGIRDLSSGLSGAVQDKRAEPLVLKADPNTNIMSQRTFIPCLKYRVASRDGSREVWLATGVFAITTKVVPDKEAFALWSRDVCVSWDEHGRLRVDGQE